MKKVTILLSVFALVAGLSQCRKPSFSALNGGETQHVVLSANNGNDGSKVDVNFAGIAMDLTWEENDKITVSGGLNGTLTLVSGAGTPTATFEGYATRGTGDVVFTYGGTPVYTGQTGTQAFVKENICLEGTSEYKDNGNYNVLMKVPYAVLKLDLSAFADDTKKDGVTVTIKADGETVASVEGVKTDSKNVYVAVKVGGTPAEKPYKFSGNNKVASCNGWELKANTFYTEKGEGVPTGNAIKIAAVPVFSVGKDGFGNPITVEFAPGNLQYLGKSDGTGTWRFAEHQWDYMGAGPSATSNKGNVDLSSLGYLAGMYNTGSGNAGGSETADDKAAARDLFGWGCTGYQDTRKESHTNWYQKNYQPYSTSKSTVNATYNKYGYGPDYVSWPYYNLTVENKSDWGCLAIGSDPAGTWRTLSSAEWGYLFNTRTVNGGKGEGKSYQRATINNDASDGSEVYGMLLYPDGYTAQTGATSYTKADWSAMESAGVVFLPAAGFRYGTSLDGVGSVGGYWSSSCSGNLSACDMYFSSGDVNPQDHYYRYYGFSVRLVR